LLIGNCYESPALIHVGDYELEGALILAQLHAPSVECLAGCLAAGPSGDGRAASEDSGTRQRHAAAPAGGATDPVFPTCQGAPLSRYTIGVVVSKHADNAAANCPSLATKRVTPYSHCTYTLL